MGHPSIRNRDEGFDPPNPWFSRSNSGQRRFLRLRSGQALRSRWSLRMTFILYLAWADSGEGGLEVRRFQAAKVLPLG